MSLSPQSRFRTDILPEPPKAPAAPLIYARQGTGFLKPSQSVMLEILPTNQTIRVAPQGHITLGRADITADWQPTIDLTPYNAAEFGVSRMHVDLFFENDQVWVLELGSSNGTRVNGLKVAIGSAQLLRNGDLLELGRMQLRVYFS
ncbi:MAG TPA: FHA domain-containing protein [Aggregatilineales bacterium]|nr:FHA domain-containing protein [Aggregatilineales bacterium]